MLTVILQSGLHGDYISHSGENVGKEKFTGPRVEAYRCESGKSQSFIWDTEAPGLGLRATAN
jgi:hypothetical protein